MTKNKPGRGKGGYARAMKRRHISHPRKKLSHVQHTTAQHPIAIVIPTLDRIKGEAVGESALAQAGCSVPVRVILVHDQQKQGFTKSVNEGIRRAVPDEDICLLNDDVGGFQPGWLETLRMVLYSNPSYGLSCPSGASAGAPMKGGQPGQKGVQVVKQASFWCVLMKRAMLDKVGLLDESFIHYCSDNWHCILMKRKGWKCVWARAVYLEHSRRGSGMQSEWRRHDRAIWLKRTGRK